MPEPDANAIHCPQCGYDLRAIEKGCCPECGLYYDTEAIRSLDRAWYVERIQELRYSSFFQIASILFCMMAILIEWFPQAVRIGRLLPGRIWPTILSLVMLRMLGRWDDQYEDEDHSFHFFRNFSLGFAGVGIFAVASITFDLGWIAFRTSIPLSGIAMAALALLELRSGKENGRHAGIEPPMRAGLAKWQRICGWLIIASFMMIAANIVL